MASSYEVPITVQLIVLRKIFDFLAWSSWRQDCYVRSSPQFQSAWRNQWPPYYNETLLSRFSHSHNCFLGLMYPTLKDSRRRHLLLINEVSVSLFWWCASSPTPTSTALAPALPLTSWVLSWSSRACSSRWTDLWAESVAAQLTVYQSASGFMPHSQRQLALSILYSPLKRFKLYSNRHCLYSYLNQQSRFLEFDLQTWLSLRQMHSLVELGLCSALLKA